MGRKKCFTDEGLTQLAASVDNGLSALAKAAADAIGEVYENLEESRASYDGAEEKIVLNGTAVKTGRGQSGG